MHGIFYIRKSQNLDAVKKIVALTRNISSSYKMAHLLIPNTVLSDTGSLVNNLNL